MGSENSQDREAKATDGFKSSYKLHVSPFQNDSAERGKVDSF